MVREARQNNGRGRYERRFARIALSEIYTSDKNRAADDPSLMLLAASIAKHGLLQPMVVRKNTDIDRYSLVCGRRRLAACRIVGIEYVDAIVLLCDEYEAAACYMEEHLTRDKPSVIRDARMITGLGKVRLCEYFALPVSLLDECASLASLPEMVQEEILKNGLSLEQAKHLLRISDPVRQMEAASIIAERALCGAQAKRLVCGGKNERAHRGKRRHAALVMDTISRAVGQLRRQGVALQVQMHTHDGGVCIRIVMKNTWDQSAQEGKVDSSANMSKVNC